MFNGSLLEINAMAGSNSSVIRALVDGHPTFDLTTAGNMTLASLKMLSGGIDVDAGGVNIGAGGLRVVGGITVESGGLDFADTTLTAASIHAKSADTASSPLIVEAVNSNFAGSVLSVKGPTKAANAFAMIDAVIGDKNVFSVSSDGNVVTEGNVKVSGDIEANKQVRVNGGLSLAKTSIRAGSTITVPPGAAFVDVTDDGASAENVLVLPSRQEGSFEGQVLIIRNGDSSPLHLKEQDLRIVFGATVLFVFDGDSWRDLHALTVQLDRLSDVKTLEVANDVYIGNHTLEAGGIKISNIERGQVLVGGIGGVLRGRQGLTYGSGILSTPSLKVNTLESDVDANSKIIS